MNSIEAKDARAEVGFLGEERAEFYLYWQRVLKAKKPQDKTNKERCKMKKVKIVGFTPSAVQKSLNGPAVQVTGQLAFINEGEEEIKLHRATVPVPAEAVNVEGISPYVTQNANSAFASYPLEALKDDSHINLAGRECLVAVQSIRSDTLIRRSLIDAETYKVVADMIGEPAEFAQLGLIEGEAVKEAQSIEIDM